MTLMTRETENMVTSISRSIANGFVVVGVIELVAASVSVVVGIFAMSTYSGHASASAGVWALEVCVRRIF